jgi:GTPase SAR1 family protein
VIVGNKSDLISEREISSETIKETIKRIGNQGNWTIPYFECSAKTRTNVDEAFVGIIRTLRDSKLEKSEPAPKKKGGCLLL